MFNGSLPIVLDSLKQHYFIDRDGKTFRHILNYMRTNRLVLPDNFAGHEALLDEAKYYELDELVKLVESRMDAQRLKTSSQLADQLEMATRGLAVAASGTTTGKFRYHPYEVTDPGHMTKAKQTALILRSAFRSGKSSVSPRSVDEEGNDASIF